MKLLTGEFYVSDNKGNNCLVPLESKYPEFAIKAEQGITKDSKGYYVATDNMRSNDIKYYLKYDFLLYNSSGAVFASGSTNLTHHQTELQLQQEENCGTVKQLESHVGSCNLEVKVDHFEKIHQYDSTSYDTSLMFSINAVPDSLDNSRGLDLDEIFYMSYPFVAPVCQEAFNRLPMKYVRRWKLLDKLSKAHLYQKYTDNKPVKKKLAPLIDIKTVPQTILLPRFCQDTSGCSKLNRHLSRIAGYEKKGFAKLKLNQKIKDINLRISSLYAANYQKIDKFVRQYFGQININPRTFNFNLYTGSQKTSDKMLYPAHTSRHPPSLPKGGDSAKIIHDSPLPSLGSKQTYKELVQDLFEKVPLDQQVTKEDSSSEAISSLEVEGYGHLYESVSQNSKVHNILAKVSCIETFILSQLSFSGYKSEIGKRKHALEGLYNKPKAKDQNKFSGDIITLFLFSIYITDIAVKKENITSLASNGNSLIEYSKGYKHPLLPFSFYGSGFNPFHKAAGWHKSTSNYLSIKDFKILSSSEITFSPLSFTIPISVIKGILESIKDSTLNSLLLNHSVYRKNTRTSSKLSNTTSQFNKLDTGSTSTVSTDKIKGQKFHSLVLDESLKIEMTKYDFKKSWEAFMKIGELEATNARQKLLDKLTDMSLSNLSFKQALKDYTESVNMSFESKYRPIQKLKPNDS
jgi:hypothetical protein